jgi:dienelactone hydrolase
MKKAGVKLEFIAYPNAVHSFTIPLAGNDNSKGAAYNAKADKESWIAFHKFLKEVF